MRRREFITLLGGAAVWPLAARAQQPKGRTRPLLGYLVTGTDAGQASLTTSFLNRLREIGYIDGRNIDIVTRYADEDITRLPGLADELVRLQPDVIVAIDPPAAFAAKKATASLPIVAAILNDPVRLGMIASYARPGGNVTGILSQVEGLPGKQVEIAQELIPGLTALGVLVNPANATHGYQRQEIEAAATSRGIKIVAVEARSKADLEPAFKALHAAGVRAGVLLRDFLFVDQFRSIAELAVTLKVATIASQDTYVEAGGLVSYGVDDSENHRRAADFVDRILKGSKPADLPVEFSTQLVTSINLRAAKALDLTIPPTLLARADKVIE
jgi:putative tryptophan/tyrosine transport system substrate-binding protein